MRSTSPARLVGLALAGILLAEIGVMPSLASEGSTPDTEGFLHHYGPHAPSSFPSGSPVRFELAGEPSIGVNPHTGNAFFQHGFDTYRINFDGARAVWRQVTAPFLHYNVDPILYTDTQTGRTYAGGLDGACSAMGYTDDDGDTWTPTGNACTATFDHQSIVSGPWRGEVLPAGLEPLGARAVYYCAHASFVSCMTSLDGGLTFARSALVSCEVVDPGVHGSLHVTPKGAAILALRYCGDHVGTAISTDNGRTWIGRRIPDALAPLEGFDPDVASTTDGWIYIGFQSWDGKPHFSLSKNEGRTWTVPRDVSGTLGLQTTVFHEMVAGENDRAAMAFLGTTEPGCAFCAGFVGEWHLYISTTLDAGASWDIRRISSDPVQRGWICARGVECASGRNLLDFMDAQLDPEGKILIAYVDGCVDHCASPAGAPWESTSAHPVVARQVTGEGLYDSGTDGTR